MGTYVFLPSINDVKMIEYTKQDISNFLAVYRRKLVEPCSLALYNQAIERKQLTIRRHHVDGQAFGCYSGAPLLHAMLQSGAYHCFPGHLSRLESTFHEREPYLAHARSHCSLRSTKPLCCMLERHNQSVVPTWDSIKNLPLLGCVLNAIGKQNTEQLYPLDKIQLCWQLKLRRIGEITNFFSNSTDHANWKRYLQQFSIFSFVRQHVLPLCPTHASTTIGVKNCKCLKHTTHHMLPFPTHVVLPPSKDTASFLFYSTLQRDPSLSPSGWPRHLFLFNFIEPYTSIQLSMPHWPFSSPEPITRKSSLVLYALVPPFCKTFLYNTYYSICPSLPCRVC